MTTTTRSTECTAATTLFMAFELGSTRWILAFATTRGTRPRLRTIAAGALDALWAEIAVAKQRFGLNDAVLVRSCYEAGRDGFWLHRALVAHGVAKVVVDPSSIAVDRRQRRAKTDRLDASKLVGQLMNAAAGDRRGWREVRVPAGTDEAERQLQREWETVREDRKRIRNRLHGLLVAQGVAPRLTASFPQQLAAVRLWDGQPLAPELITRLQRSGPSCSRLRPG
jgi:transposase